jgi:NAD(P)-dependent dehydrogenase (short-subunit alcohol dehydrogenase family)
MQKGKPRKKIFKGQQQERPGLEYLMDPQPVSDNLMPGSLRLRDRKCVITGGDSGIGRAVAIAFAREGAMVAIVYLPAEQQDAEDTAAIIRTTYQGICYLVPADLSTEGGCKKAAKQLLRSLEQVDVLVNNAAVHYPQKQLEDISDEQLLETFSVNVFSMFRLTKALLPYISEGGSIINSSSVTAYRGSGGLLDYSATKGAIISFTRSLSANLAGRKIRVNAVAPGPVWTPLIPSSFPPDHISTYGTDTPMQRPAQPAEVAPAYVFLASSDGSYISGQVIHVNGGEIVNG